jgi:uncharacterized membrane protein YdjX (TVP38/TMEM64 family)
MRFKGSNLENKDKKQGLPLIAYGVALAVFIFLLVFVTVRYESEISQLARDPEKFREWLDSFGSRSIPVFIFFQIIQIVVAWIPGEVIQIAGGYIYGSLWGSVYLLAGVLIGTAITFYTARLLGYPLISRLIDKKNLTRFKFLIDSDKAESIMLIFYVIPGIPKDILNYIAGLTRVKPARFIILSTLARLPALYASTVMGASLERKQYLIAIILFSAAVVLFTAGVLFRTRIIRWVQKFFHKDGPEEKHEPEEDEQEGRKLQTEESQERNEEGENSIS